MFAFILVHLLGQTRCTGTFGRDFYIGILKTFYDPAPQFSLLITSNMTGTAIIYIPHLGINTTRNFNQSLEYKVTGDTITKVNTTVEHKGIHVTTDVDVTLTVMKYPSALWEGFLALPSTILSSEYIISSGYSFQGYSNNSTFLVLAVHDNTSINVDVHNNTLKVTLNRLDTYLVWGLNDLSGAVVFSNKPIAVFSGHEGGISQTTCGTVEYLVEQLLPTKHFAREFIVPPVPPKSQYVVRIYSSTQNTSITYCDTTNQSRQLLLKAGDFHEILSGNDAMYVFANKPVQVMLYSTSYNDNIGNVFMSIVPAVSQYRHSYHFSVIGLFFGLFTHYLTIIANTEDISGLRINGNQMGKIFHSYVTHANNETFTVNVHKLSAGEYHLYHVTGRTFGAIQYGFSTCLSYGYPLGMEVFKEGDENDGLKCFNCKGLTHLYLCDTVTKCLGDQVCYVETYRTNNGQVKYNSGCLAYKQCPSHKRQTSHSTSECVHCCSSTLCNSNGCGTEGLPPASLRGPLCYNCPYVPSMDECTSVMLCSRDEVCSIEKFDFGEMYDHYTTKCQNKQCISHKRQTDVTSARESRSTPVCKTCCDADLCNFKCSNTSQNGTDVIIVG